MFQLWTAGRLQDGCKSKWCFHWIRRCSEASAGHEAAGAVAFIQVLGSSIAAFEKPDIGLREVRRVEPFNQIKSDLLLASRILQKYRHCQVRDRVNWCKSLNLRFKFMNEVDNVFLRLLQGGINWTFWNPANDDDVLADLLDQTLIEVAPELISYKSAAMENCHQDATGA